MKKAKKNEVWKNNISGCSFVCTEYDCDVINDGFNTGNYAFIHNHFMEKPDSYNGLKQGNFIIAKKYFFSKKYVILRNPDTDEFRAFAEDKKCADCHKGHSLAEFRYIKKIN